MILALKKDLIAKYHHILRLEATKILRITLKKFCEARSCALNF
jgi:hypothetical protein